MGEGVFHRGAVWGRGYSIEGQYGTSDIWWDYTSLIVGICRLAVLELSRLT